MKKFPALRVLFGAGLAAALMPGAHASPIEYTLTVPYAGVIGNNNYSYSGYATRFVFDGDDTDVFKATVPFVNIDFAAIYQGSAKVQILNGSTVVQTATFLPNQIVVSSDRSNGGLGFGFVPGGIGATGFDVSQFQPLYPMSITNFARGASGYPVDYDLTLAFAQAHAGIGYPAPALWPTGLIPFAADGSADIVGAVFSCNGFSGFLFSPGCTLGPAIKTDQGDFSITPLVSLGGTTPGNTATPVVGTFTARPLDASATVPEPASLTLVVPALAFLATQRRRAIK